MITSDPVSGDYVHQAGNPDNAGAAVWALMHGRFHDLVQVQPLIGLTSLIWRLPFAAVGHATGGLLGEYRFGAFACAWPLATFAFVVGGSLRTQPLLVRLLAPLLILLAPATTRTITAGHPEEMLLGALAAAGVWAVVAGRVGVGAVLIGLAIGTKPFGVFALLAALLAVPSAWRRVVPVSALVAALLTLPLPLASPHIYRDHSRQLAQYKRVYSGSLWWPVADTVTRPTSTGQPGGERLTLHVMPAGTDRGTAAPALALVALALAGYAWLIVRREGALGANGLALLAACLLARSALDPENLEYYAGPAIVALVAWEVVARRRPPILSIAAVAGELLTFHAGLGRADLQATVFAIWTLAILAGTTMAVRHPT